MESLGSRIKNAWNVFRDKDPIKDTPKDYGESFYYRPDRLIISNGNERTIVTSIYNRIALDVSAIGIRHVRLDDNGRFLEEIKSGLNKCFSLEANLDQSSRSFIQDLVMSMFDEGCVAICPTDTSVNPEIGSFDVFKMRVGKITSWYPRHVKVNLYNENTGKKEDILFSKNAVGIIENPLYSVMNEPSSTMQRLIRKLRLLDAIDEQSGAGKLDLIIQLPYVIKTEARRNEAERRRSEIEKQLAGSKYGIAYTDGTERVTQLNRSLENNLMGQIEYLTNLLYSQLGITQEIMNGTADDKAMLNYDNRTIDPIISAICDECKRKFLTKTARSQKQSIAYFKDPFRLVPVANISEIADKFTRNEIMSPNEIRQIIGLKPASDPNADELRNRNINQAEEELNAKGAVGANSDESNEADIVSAILESDQIDMELDDMESELKHSELIHYASPYYDPVKAHEYYTAHRKLKGRKSTSGLNDKGKEAAQYVKKSLNEEEKQIKESHDAKSKASIESHKAKMQSQIDSLNARLKSMSVSDKKANKKAIQEQIIQIREYNKQWKAGLKAALKEVKSNTSA